MLEQWVQILNSKTLSKHDWYLQYCFRYKWKKSIQFQIKIFSIAKWKTRRSVSMSGVYLCTCVPTSYRRYIELLDRYSKNKIYWKEFAYWILAHTHMHTMKVYNKNGCNVCPYYLLTSPPPLPPSLQYFVPVMAECRLRIFSPDIICAHWWYCRSGANNTFLIPTGLARECELISYWKWNG